MNRSRKLVPIIFGAFLVLAGCSAVSHAAGGVAAQFGPAADPTLAAAAVPADVTAAVAPADASTISADQAIAVAQAHLPQTKGAQLEANLVTATDPNTLRGAIDIDKKTIWIVHASGISKAVSIPAGVSVKPEQASLTNGYVYIDAQTGEWLMSRFE